MEDINFEKMSVMEMRKYMSGLGWSSEDRLSDIGWGGKGNYGYSIWFERWEWHGKSTLKTIGNKVCIHSHTDDLDNIRKIVEKTAKKALKAYEDFQDKMPYQNKYGEMVEAKEYPMQ